MEMNTIFQEAVDLIQQYASKISAGAPIGAMSTSVYDTAWASMVLKEVNGQYLWLFPESFQILLDSQLQDGGWESDITDIDGILNTMAGLLATLRHRREARAINEPPHPEDFYMRHLRAMDYLEKKLQTWDVSTTDHVGFEMLVPTHLRLLEEYGHKYDFPGRQLLMSLYEKKIARFDPRFLYSGKQTTFAHSLEVFSGQIDFVKAKTQLSNGSMMASPSATAAYLIESSTWDDEAEVYLRRVFEHGAGQGDGGFPSAFPSETFELSWILSALLDAGISVEQLSKEAVMSLGDHLENSLHKHGGVVGFSDGLLPDADDTAKTISVLHSLGRNTFTAEKLIDHFWTGNFFRTYTSERNPSLSANCNALKTLLALPDAELYSSYISRTVTFLCEMWENGGIKDKWNNSPEYSTMLLVQGLMKLLRKWDTGEMDEIPDDLMHHRVAIVLAQALSRSVQSQLPNGSWGAGSCEVTAYAISTLVELSTSPWAAACSELITFAITRGRQFLVSNRNDWETGPKLWIEKVTYKIPILARAYCIAALHVPMPSDTWTRIPCGPLKKTVQMLPKFFSKLPIFRKHRSAEFKLKAAMVESFPFLQYLRSIKSDIFSQDKAKAKEDKYLEYIPFTWTACNAFGENVPTSLLKDMMVLSMLNYQVDEYMEDFVGKNCAHDLHTLGTLIDEICGLRKNDWIFEDHTMPHYKLPRMNAKRRRLSTPDEFPSKSRRTLTAKESTQSSSFRSLSEVKATLTSYTQHIIQHPAVLRAPSSVQSYLAHDLAQFLKAHVKQISDNIRLKSPSGINYTGTETFHSWVHGTGANHTSCPMSWTFFCCLISKEGSFCFKNATEEYLANDVRLHLATMCRIYNDLGSIRRDREEGNLNSADFPGFDSPNIGASQSGGDNDVAKTDSIRKRTKELLVIGEHEREAMMTAFAKLKDGLGEEARRGLELLVDVTDLYGQIYVARDIGVATGKQN
ncbi:Ent-kaurene synthase [Melanomma pulvis-pyrius CBS 109.77]|uniref:Ent-kaurene synthase n=1 Tax=Melanomma pulvis-pyrius CBS 109.77 TaxID=1314802 RepID=A0A6A6X8U6_9PLEO|nr:Ent-kaurene synthase [Melanomma pulvis-pyrius CBS 109.77]